MGAASQFDVILIWQVGFERSSSSKLRALGVRACGSGFRVQGAGCRVQGSGFRVRKVSTSTSMKQDVTYWRRHVPMQVFCASLSSYFVLPRQLRMHVCSGMLTSGSFKSCRFFELPPKADTGTCSLQRPCFLSDHIGQAMNRRVHQATDSILESRVGRGVRSMVQP